MIRAHEVVDILNGNIRHWGYPQLRRFHAAVGKFQKVGIEWESNTTSLSSEKKKFLAEQGVLTSWSRPPDPIYRSDKCGSCEVTYLFTVGSPGERFTSASTILQFRKEAMKVHKLLHDTGIGTFGSVHINFQVRKDGSATTKQPGFYAGMYLKSIPNYSFSHGYKRAEAKWGSGYFHPYDLICQIILGGIIFTSYDRFFARIDVDTADGRIEESEFLKITKAIYELGGDIDKLQSNTFAQLDKQKWFLSVLRYCFGNHDYRYINSYEYSRLLGQFNS